MSASYEQLIQVVCTRVGSLRDESDESSPLQPSEYRWNMSPLLFEALAELSVYPRIARHVRPRLFAHLQHHGALTTLDEAVVTRGAVLIKLQRRRQGPAAELLALSLGDGTTLEFRNGKLSMGVFAIGRFSHAGLLPGIDYRPSDYSPKINQGAGVQLLSGARGSAVGFLQNMLGFLDGLGSNNMYDGHTVERVAGFQSQHGLEATGFADPETCKTLGQVLASAPSFTDKGSK
jgi:hypothetical protein